MFDKKYKFQYGMISDQVFQNSILLLFDVRFKLKKKCLKYKDGSGNATETQSLKNVINVKNIWLFWLRVKK